MKKLRMYITFVTITLLLLLGSCNINVVKSTKITLLAPSGTPSLGISNFLDSEEANLKYEIVSGSDPLVSAFINQTHDIIIAPVNLGVKMYYNNGNYLHYKAFVWGNTYIASRNPIDSLVDLADKSVVAFGETSTPGLVLKSLLKYNGINCNVTYMDSVSDANAQLLTGKAEIILTAEPSLSKINSAGDLFVLDLQTLWMEMTGEYSYPQAGIYVKKSIATNSNIQEALVRLVTAVQDTTDVEKTASSAIKIDTSFQAMGVEVLKKAIPNCHFAIIENDSFAIDFYLNKLNELGYANQYGGKLPDEDFYLN